MLVQHTAWGELYLLSNHAVDFPEGFNKPFLALNAKLFQFSFQNQIWFLIYLCDFAALGLGLSHRQISNSNTTRTKLKLDGLFVTCHMLL